MGNYAKTCPVVACVWDEPTAGRSANEILSCFVRVINRFNDKDKIVLWLDNCSGQNKNWNLFMYLILLINSEDMQVQEVVLKYFESGHTFMAADSFHASVEARMRRGKPVVTMDDFETAVKNAKKRVDAMKIEPGDFLSTSINVSQYTLNNCKPRPYIDDIRKVIIRKGTLMFQYSSEVGPDGKVRSCNLLSKKQQRIVNGGNFRLETHTKRQVKARGIDSERKRTLLQTVLPVICNEDREYWNNVPIIQK